MPNQNGNPVDKSNYRAANKDNFEQLGHIGRYHAAVKVSGSFVCDGSGSNLPYGVGAIIPVTGCAGGVTMSFHNAVVTLGDLTAGQVYEIGIRGGNVTSGAIYLLYRNGRAV